MLDRLASVESELLNRWPENKLEPTLDRIRALLDLVGNPHRGVPAIHITGTNAKSTTARMIDELLRSAGLRTGRYTSPHLESVRERIVIDGSILDATAFVDTYEELRPHIRTVDNMSAVPLSFFEIVTAIGLVSFARARVDAMVIEVGMGGTWDATNVVDGRVAVITPVSLDHQDYLGADEIAIATEKSGIVKFGSTLVAAPQLPGVTDVLKARTRDIGATFVSTGQAVNIVERALDNGRQILHLRTGRNDYSEITLPIVGHHQAENACTAVAAAEIFLAESETPLNPGHARHGFSQVTAPGRLETVSASPTTVIDASHNPAGMQVSTLGFREAHPHTKTVVVLAVLGDKDIDGILQSLADTAWRLVLTENESPRRLPVEQLAAHARTVVSREILHIEPDMARALTFARELARSEDDRAANVLVTGSVITAGQARRLLAR